MGAFLVALLAHRATVDEEAISAETLSEVSGFSEDELEELESGILGCMNQQLRVAVDEMVWENDFRKLNEVECPRAAERRKRLMEMEKEGIHERPHFRRSISSFWRSRGKTESVMEGSLSSATSSASCSSSDYSSSSSHRSIHV